MWDLGNTFHDAGKTAEVIKAWTLATRLFRGLRFTKGDASKRTGRPTDTAWSAARKLGRRAG